MIDTDLNWNHEDEDEEYYEVEDEYANGQPVVFCKDCVHYVRTLGMRLGQVDPRCARTFKPEVDIVSGKVSKPDPYQMNKCKTMRGPGSGCGKEGAWWKPKKETPETTLILLKRKVPQ